MKRFDVRGFAAFQPPSDMTGGDGGGSSGKKKIWMGLGIGCGVVLLVIGILFAAGAFKAVSCCNTVKDVAEQSQGAQQFGMQFATAVADGQLQQAYDMTSSDFQAKLDFDSFESAVEAHSDRLDASPPRLFDVQVKQQDPDNPSLDDLSSGVWQMGYQFAGPSDDQMLLLNFTVRRVGEGDEATFVAENVRFDERARNLAAEPPAREVMKVHDLLQQGRYERAYMRFGDQFKAESDQDTFRQFLDESGDVLTNSTLEIREVSYNDANTQATVMAHATTTAGKNAIVQYELAPLQPNMPGFGWRVVTISPMIAEVESDGPDAPVPPMPPSDEEDPGPEEGGEESAADDPAQDQPSEEPAKPVVK